MAEAAAKLPVRTDKSAAVRSSIFDGGRTAIPAVPARDPSRGPMSLDDVRCIVGDVDDATALAILALNPTTADLERAALSAAGNSDALGRQIRSLTRVAGAILDLLTADEDEP